MYDSGYQIFRRYKYLALSRRLARIRGYRFLASATSRFRIILSRGGYRVGVFPRRASDVRRLLYLVKIRANYQLVRGGGFQLYNGDSNSLRLALFAVERIAYRYVDFFVRIGRLRSLRNAFIRLFFCLMVLQRPWSSNRYKM